VILEERAAKALGTGDRGCIVIGREGSPFKPGRKTGNTESRARTYRRGEGHRGSAWLSSEGRLLPETEPMIGPGSVESATGTAW